MIRRGAVILGIIIMLAQFLFVWAPAMAGRGDIDLTAVAILTVLGLGLIIGGVVAMLVRANQRTNGAVLFGLKAAGTAYVGYKAGIGTARHLHNEITRH